MKWFLIFWAGPIVFLGTWYQLSYYDMNFGTFFLSRQMHDLVFEIYGKILGIPPEELPGLVARAICLDTLIVFGLVLLRRHRAIRAWWRARYGRPRVDALESDESLSKAP